MFIITTLRMLSNEGIVRVIKSNYMRDGLCLGDDIVENDY